MSKKKRILLIDDDGGILQVMSIRLRAAGYEVVAVSDGPAGLAAAVSERPDAIILDIRMAGMAGLEVLDKLREQQRTADIPVVMLSASIVDQKRALDCGAQFFLEKPYNSETLIAAIEKVTIPASALPQSL